MHTHVHSNILYHGQDIERINVHWKNQWAKNEIHKRRFNGMIIDTENKEILTYVTTWMNLKATILSEISQTERTKYHVIAHKRRILNVKLIKVKRWMVLTSSWGEGETQRCVSDGKEFQLCFSIFKAGCYMTLKTG